GEARAGPAASWALAAVESRDSSAADVGVRNVLSRRRAPQLAPRARIVSGIPLPLIGRSPHGSVREIRARRRPPSQADACITKLVTIRRCVLSGRREGDRS